MKLFSLTMNFVKKGRIENNFQRLMWKVLFINLAIFVFLAKSEDFTINVNNKKVINVIKNEFVSFSVEPENLFDGSGNVIR